MTTAKIRKIVTIVEETHNEADQPIRPATRRAAAVAVIENPFAGRYVEDLEALMVIGEELGAQLGAACVAALGIEPAAAQSYMPPRSCIHGLANRCVRQLKKAPRWCRQTKSVVGWGTRWTCHWGIRMPPMSDHILTAWKYE